MVHRDKFSLPGSSTPGRTRIAARVRSIPLVLAALIANLLAVSAWAEHRALRLGTIIPDNTIWAEQAALFVRNVDRESGGQLQVDYFGNAQLGTMRDTLKMVMNGRLDLWIGAVPALSGVINETTLLALPYLFDDPAEAACAVPKMASSTRKLAGKRFHLLTFIPVGSQALGLRQPARVPADLAGVKLRTAPLKSTVTLFRSIGANVVPLAAAQTLAALSTGLVDGVDFAPTYYLASGSSEQAPYLVLTEHVYNIGAVVVSSRAWAALDDPQKEALRRAAALWDFGQQAQDIEAHEADLVAQHRKTGGQVIALTATEQARWKAAGQAIWADVKDTLRGDPDAYLNQILAARAACRQ